VGSKETKRSKRIKKNKASKKREEHGCGRPLDALGYPGGYVIGEEK